MQANDRHTDSQRRGQQRPDARHKHDHDRRQDETEQRLAVREAAPEENQRPVGGAEEVEEHPRGEEGEEDEERERVGEEGEGEDEGDDRGVVDFEVGEVLADPGEGVGERVGSGEGVSIYEFYPRAAL